MPLFTTGTPILGGGGDDFIIATAGTGPADSPADSRVDAGDGNDVIYGDLRNVARIQGGTPALAAILTNVTGWGAEPHDDIGNSNPAGPPDWPGLTAFVAPQAGAYAWYRVDVAAGQRIALDIDYADRGPGGGGVETHLALLTANGGRIIAESVADAGSLNGGTGNGSLTPRDPSLVHTFTAAGSYLIRVGEGAGSPFGAGRPDVLLHTLLTGQPLSGQAVAGDDSLSGGNGDDRILGLAGNDSLYGGAGNDTLFGGEGRNTLYGGAGNDVFTGERRQDVLFGGGGSDYASVLGGSAQMGAGDDWLSVRRSTGGLFDGGDGTDRLAIDGDFSGARFDMSSGVMVIARFGVFTDFEDLFDYSRGGNILIGSAGDNWLVGGVGADDLRGRGGTDWTSYERSDRGVSIDLSSGDGFGGEAEGDRLSGIENVWGSRRADEMTGNNQDNDLRGEGGADFLDGLGGNDTLIGRAGDDIIYGRGGNDRLEGDEGDDTLFGGAGDDALVTQYGGGRDAYYGGDGRDTLSGGTGDDWFFGGAGNDAFYGGSGANTLQGDDGDDLLIDDLGTGGYLLGGAGHDRIRAGGGNDWIEGGDGNDRIDANGGTNRIFGGAGDDTVNAYEGADRIDGGAGNDEIQALGGANSVDGGAGDDTIYGGLDSDLLLGGADHDRLIGVGGADTLFGGLGNDRLSGGAGTQTLDGGDGVDWTEYEFSAQAVTVRLWNNTGQGGDAQGDILSGIESIRGSAFNDILIGRDAEAGELWGGTGDDYLDGLGGSDTLMGDLGRDTAGYTGSAQGVTVRLWNGTGQGGSAQGDVLGGIENVTGSAHADVLIGHDMDANTLTGGAGNDYLDGLGGDDRLDGGAGNDTLAGGAGADRFVFAPLTGFDVVTAFQDGTDRVALAPGLTFAQLTLAQGGAGVIVTITGSFDDEVLELRGVTLAQVTAADFI